MSDNKNEDDEEGRKAPGSKPENKTTDNFEQHLSGGLFLLLLAIYLITIVLAINSIATLIESAWTIDLGNCVSGACGANPGTNP
jgi:hypothetical protein